MIRTIIQLTDEQAAALKALAARRGASVAELVRQGVDHILAEDEQAGRLARLRAISGRHHGPSDLGRRHDEYLAEAYAADDMTDTAADER